MLHPDESSLPILIALGDPMNRSYMGKVLWVDLTTGRITTEAIPDDIYNRFLSGTGLAAWLLYRRIPAGADP